jgi:colicin import membrane protein
MHLVLALLIIYGIHWQTNKPEVVAVELVRAVPPAPTPAPEPKPEPAPEPKPEPKPERKPEPPPPKPEPKPDPVKPLPKPEIAQKEKPKPPPKPEPKPAQPPEPPKPDPFQEQLKREAEQLQRQKAAASAAQELDQLKAQRANAAKATALTEYIARIQGKVRGNIVLPGDLNGNPEAVFEVTQLPSGEVLAVKLKKSSGHPAWDGATERAILKSSPLPKPAQSELFNRTLELKFRPLEE